MQAGYDVDVIGYQGSVPIQALLSDSNISLHHIPDL